MAEEVPTCVKWRHFAACVVKAVQFFKLGVLHTGSSQGLRRILKLDHYFDNVLLLEITRVFELLGLLWLAVLLQMVATVFAEALLLFAY